MVSRFLPSLLLLALSVQPAIAQSTTWLANPLNGNWNTVGNWTGGVPAGSSAQAIFGTSSTVALSLSGGGLVNSITFNPGASAFTITAPAHVTLILSGTGIVNNSGVTQNFAATVDTSGSNGTIQFTNSATAGSQTVFTVSGDDGSTTGVVQFYNTSSAASATFINQPMRGNVGGTLGTQFFDATTAANATLINNGSATDFTPGGRTWFSGTATAAHATITNNGATTANSAWGGTTDFFGSSTAGNSTITNNGGSAIAAYGGRTTFYSTSTAADSTIINNGGTTFGAQGGSTTILSTAGNSTLIANGGTGGGSGGIINFFSTGTGGTSRVEVYGDGNVVIGGLDTAGVSIGSLEGTGVAYLGAKKLTVGTNNLSTTFSGTIQDGGIYSGTGGSFAKIGTSTFTLSGANTYTGGTTISAGTLLANNLTGSALGTGPVTVASGATLGGNGYIGGLTTVNAGGHLAPGNSPGTLTFTNGLTLASGSILDFQFGTASDRIDVTGGTLTGPAGTGGLTLNLSNSGNFAPGVSYTLFNFVSGQTSSFDVADFTFGALIGTTVASDYSFTLTGTSLSLIYNGSGSAIPEPATYAAILGVGALGFAVWRRRRSRL